MAAETSPANSSVALIALCDWQLRAGAHTYLTNVLRCLKSAGFLPTLYAIVINRLDCGFPKDEWLRDLSDGANRIVLTVCKDSAMHYARRAWVLTRTARREVGQGRYGAVFIRQPDLAMSFLSGRTASPQETSLIRLQEALVEEIIFHKRKLRPLLRFVLSKFAERWSMRWADFVLPVSCAMAAYNFAEYGISRKRQHILPSLVDVAVFKTDLAARQRLRAELGWRKCLIMIYFGSLAVWQGFDEVVRYFRLAQSLEERCRLLVLSAEQPEAERKLQKAGVRQNFYRVRSVLRSEVPGFLNAADLSLILKLPSLIIETCSPTKFAESLACGVPALVSSCTKDAAQYVLQHSVGTVIDVSQPETWPQTALFLKELQEERERFGERCKACAEADFSLGNGAKVIARILCERRSAKLS